MAAAPTPQPQIPLPNLPTNKLTSPVKTILSMVGIAVFGAALFGLGFWFQSQRKTQTPTPVSTTPPATSKEVSTFTGEKLKISFQYPSEWGSVKEEIIPIGDAQNYHGNNYKLSFSRNPYLTLVGASKDSSSPGVGGACPIRQFFNGTEHGITACSQCNTEQEGCLACKETTISAEPAVSYLYRPTASCAILGFQKIVYLKTPFNSANSDFPGLVIVMSIANQLNTQLTDLGYRSGSACPGDGAEAEQQRQYLTKIFSDDRQQVETSLLSSTPSDYVSQIQLKEFQDFLTSFHFNP